MNVVDSVNKVGEERYFAGHLNNAAFYTADGLKYEFYRGYHMNQGHNSDGATMRPYSGWKAYTYESTENNPNINGGHKLVPCFGSTAPNIISCVNRDENGTCIDDQVCAEEGTDSEGNTTCLKTRREKELEMEGGCGGCGSRGLVENPEYNKPPCIIVVDVNADKKPNPPFFHCKNQQACGIDGDYENIDIQKYALPTPRTYSGAKNTKKLTDLFTIMITENKAVPYGTYAQRMMYKK